MAADIKIQTEPAPGDDGKPAAPKPFTDPRTEHMKSKWTMPTVAEVEKTDDNETKTDVIPDDATPVAGKEADAGKPASGKAPEPKPEDDDAKWPRSSKDWKAFKEAAKTREAEARKAERELVAKEYEARLAEVAAKSSTSPPDYEDIKKQRDELSETLRIANVEKHPDFIRHFNGRIDLQIATAKKIAGAEYADDIEKALKLPAGETRDAKVEEIACALSPMQQSRIAALVNVLDNIHDERQQVIANARENGETLAQRDKAAKEAAAAQSKQTFEKAFNTVLTQATDKENGNPVLMKTGDPEWDKGVDDRIALAKNIMFGNLQPDEYSKAALYAASLPATLKLVSELKAENKALQDKVKSLGSATPKLGQSTEAKSTPGIPAKPKIQSGMRPMDAAKAWMQSMSNE